VRRVLVVDDDRWVRNLLVATLSGAHVEVLLAADGAAALQQAITQRPDLIVLDVRLPDCDGVTLCRRLREHPASAHTPVLILTADHQAATQQASLAAGAAAFCTKPFSPTALLNLLDRCLEPPRTQAA
jgi:CheY-like chemotaxis protein